MRVDIYYTNWKGIAKYRRITPMKISFESNEWHPEPQWLLTAYDEEKEAVRHFAMKDIEEWKEIG